MKNILKNMFGLIGLLILTSCLKDNDIIGPNASGSISDIIEFGDLASPVSNVTSTIPMYALSFDMQPTSTLNLKVKAVGNGLASQDIDVVVAIDNSLLGIYNKQNESDYVALPSGQYSMASTSVTIKKGEREALLPIALKPDQFTFDEDYALGLVIKSVSKGNISGNFGKIILNINGKNAYDGSYSYKTSANTSLVPNANKSAKLITVGANRVKLSPGLLATYSNEVYYNIDPVTFNVTVECPSLGVQEPQDVRSKWDAASKTMVVFWKQGNGGRTFEETFTFVGPR